MPKRPPSICSCGKAVASGTRCPCKRAVDRERKARHDANRPPASERGYGHKWRTERAKFLAANRCCVMCGTASTVVDHVVAHRGDLKLFWRRSNWQALCAPCHNGRKQRAERST